MMRASINITTRDTTAEADQATTSTVRARQYN
jgi:hypothetical protein